MKKWLLIIIIVLLFPSSVLANIICNDGTVSPKCTDCHKGCCSKHGGCTSSSSNEKKNTNKTTTVKGCTDNKASNYNSKATKDNGSCEYNKGCTDKEALNYDEKAIIDNGTCIYEVLGCMNNRASNYNSKATKDDGSCTYEISSDDFNIDTNDEVDEEMDNFIEDKDDKKVKESTSDIKNYEKSNDESINPIVPYAIVGGFGYAIYDKIKRKNK